MKRQLMLAVVCSAVLMALPGCSNTESTETSAKVVEDDFWDDFEGVVDREESDVSDSLAPIDLRLVIKPGLEQNYRLTNDITTIVHSQYDASVTEEYTSYLHADQSVVVDEIENFYIHTTGVEGGVEGEGLTVAVVDRYMKSTVAAIEGSMLVAAYDEKGSGKNIRLIGDGIGLNPLGAQSGSQDSVMGFMGILLPGGKVKPGDSWTGVYDISQAADEFFKGKGVRTSSGTIPLTYVLRGYDEERGLAQIGIFGEGSSVVDLPMGSSIVKIKMEIKIEGEALVRLSDGWLHELRVQTHFVTDGYSSTDHTVKTVIKAVSGPKNSS